VGAASRSEAIGAIEEVGFIDSTQDLGHRALDDFISLWGAPRIHGELLKLGIEVGETTVAK
jgi:hypothetical protein